MSHDATNWAIQRRGLKPTTKIVLWHLCDRFNPDYGCFPSQVRLAHDCEISRATLNTHLGLLEQDGLLRRERRVDPTTKRHLSTRYILGFEANFTPAPQGCSGANAAACDFTDQIPCPDSGHGSNPANPKNNNDLPEIFTAEPCPDAGQGAVSRKQADPCPENRESRVQNLDTNLVREPLRKPVKEEEDARARDSDFDLFFAELLSALGFAANATLPTWWQAWPARTHVKRWRDDLGLTKDRIIEIATDTRRDHPNPPDGPKALDRFMERAAQRDAQSIAANASNTQAKRQRKRAIGPAPSEDELAAFYAAKVNSDAYLPQNMISSAICALMLARGLVTPERLRMRGVL